MVWRLANAVRRLAWDLIVIRGYWGYSNDLVGNTTSSRLQAIRLDRMGSLYARRWFLRRGHFECVFLQFAPTFASAVLYGTWDPGGPGISIPLVRRT